MPKASSSRNIREHLLLAAILQDNYSIQLCLEGRTSKAAGAADLERSVQR